MNWIIELITLELKRWDFVGEPWMPLVYPGTPKLQVTNCYTRNFLRTSKLLCKSSCGGREDLAQIMIVGIPSLNA